MLTCAICCESLEEEDEQSNPRYTLQCGHIYHTKCLLQNSWHGNIECAVCRQLPISNVNVDIAMENLEASYAVQNDRDEMKLFLAGVRKGRKKQGSKKLIDLVANYDRFLLAQKMKADKDRKVKEMFKKFKEDCHKAVEKVRKLKRYADTDAKKFKIRFGCVKTSAMSKRFKDKRLRSFRRRIASAVGFQGLEVLC